MPLIYASRQIFIGIQTKYYMYYIVSLFHYFMVCFNNIYLRLINKVFISFTVNIKYGVYISRKEQTLTWSRIKN